MMLSIRELDAGCVSRVRFAFRGAVDAGQEVKDYPLLSNIMKKIATTQDSVLKNFA